MSPYVGLQGVGQFLLKLLVKLPSPALAWIPELCGANFTDQKLEQPWRPLPSQTKNTPTSTSCSSATAASLHLTNPLRLEIDK